MKRLLCLSLAVPALASAQFASEFPQFRDISGLPGGGYGLTLRGDPSIRGAMALSTPIGFSLGAGKWNVGFASRSNTGRFALPSTRRSGSADSDGTIQLMHGFHTPVGNLTVAGMVLSSEGDSVLNLQLQLPTKWARAGASIGVQNVFNRPHAAADKAPGENRLSRSVFAVGTYEYHDGSFVSLGLGGARFNGLFGNACYLVQPRLKLTAEYDTFAFNAGVAYTFGRLGSTGGRLDNGDLTLWIGAVEMKRATIALNYSF